MFNQMNLEKPTKWFNLASEKLSADSPSNNPETTMKKLSEAEKTEADKKITVDEHQKLMESKRNS